MQDRRQGSVQCLFRNRDGAGTFIDKLWQATESVYLECLKIMLEYLILSDNLTISLDTFHKRMWRWNPRAQ